MCSLICLNDDVSSSMNCKDIIQIGDFIYFILYRIDSAVQSGVTLMFVACVVWLKLVSYAHTNYDMRAVANSAEKVTH